VILVHVALSTIGIVSRFVVSFGMLRGKRFVGWTALFLITTIQTSVTGFLFLSTSFTPAQGGGIVSLVVLALYVYGLVGSWCWVYVIGPVFALYFNAFRQGRTGFPEASVSATIDADAIRATIRRLAGYCDGSIDRARHDSREEISPGVESGDVDLDAAIWRASIRNAASLRNGKRTV